MSNRMLDSAGDGAGAIPINDVTVYCTGTPRAPTSIGDNLVHELTDTGGAGMIALKHYSILQIGGADICVYMAAAAPNVATCRRGFDCYNGIEREFCPPVAGLRFWGVKAVDGTADASVKCVPTDGGTGY